MDEKKIVIKLTAKEKNYLYISLLIIFLAITIIFFTHPNISDQKFYSHDYLFHYHAASGDEINVPDKFEVRSNQVEEYPPLTRIISSPFAYNMHSFFWFSLLLFFLIGGLLMFFLTKHWVSVLFWVSSSASWFFFQGPMAQGVFTFLFILFVFGNWKIRLLLLFVGMFSHNYALILMIGYWVFELLFSTDFKAALFGFCGGGVVQYDRVAQTKPLVSDGGINLNSSVNVLGKTGLTFTAWITVLRWFVFMPHFFLGFYGLYLKNKKWFWFTTIIFVGAGLLLYWRIVESLVFFLIIGLTEYYKRSSNKMKILLIVLCVLLFALRLMNYLFIMDYSHLSLTGNFFGLFCFIGGALFGF